MNTLICKPQCLTSQASLPLFKEQLSTIFNKTDTFSDPIPNSSIKQFSKHQSSPKHQLSKMIERQPQFSLLDYSKKVFEFQKTLFEQKSETKVIEDHNNQVSVQEFDTLQKNISRRESHQSEIDKQQQACIQLFDIQTKENEKINDDNSKKVFLTYLQFPALQNNAVNQKNYIQKFPQTQKITLNQTLILDILGESRQIFDKSIYPAFKRNLLCSKISIIFSTLLLITRILISFLSSTYNMSPSIYLFCTEIFLWDLGVVIKIKYLKVFKNIPLNISLLLIVISLIFEAFGYYFSISNNWDNNTIVILDIILAFIETGYKWLNDIQKNLILGKLLRSHHNKFKGASSSLLQSFL